jgi:hypothetical protein
MMMTGLRDASMRRHFGVDVAYRWHDRALDDVDGRPDDDVVS